MLNIHIGQCGNQLGEAFYDQLYQEIKRSSPAHQALSLDYFFIQQQIINKRENKIHPRSILIDMEPKVVNSILNMKNQNYQFNKNYSYINQMGSGNNWAYGFNTHGPQNKEQILKKIQCMIEKTDFVDGIMIWQSLAGGTGSGLGTYLTKVIKEEFPEIKIFNTAVLPNIGGEVIIQNYNCVFSIGELQENRQKIQSSDGILLFENDHIQFTCLQLQQIKNPNLTDLNKIISKQMVSVFYPVIDPNQKVVYSSQQNQFQFFQDIYENLLLDPNYKLMKIFNVPMMSESVILQLKSKDFTNDTWQGLEKRLFQMILSNSTEANINWQITQKSQFATIFHKKILVSRGVEYKNHQFQKNFYDKILIDSHQFDRNDKSLSVISNGTSFNDKIEKIIVSASSMFQQKAFYYQFQKHGITEMDFVDNLAVCEQILSNYQKLQN